MSRNMRQSRSPSSDCAALWAGELDGASTSALNNSEMRSQTPTASSDAAKAWTPRLPLPALAPLSEG